MKLLGHKASVPEGWSLPPAVLSTRWPFAKNFPPVWGKGRRATQKDITAIIEYRKRKALFFAPSLPYYDKGTICGNDDEEGYRTMREEYLKDRKHHRGF